MAIGIKEESEVFLNEIGKKDINKISTGNLYIGSAIPNYEVKEPRKKESESSNSRIQNNCITENFDPNIRGGFTAGLGFGLTIE